MEQQTERNVVLTKANEQAHLASQNAQNTGGAKGVYLSAKDAEEFRSFKRQKKVEEIMTAIARSGAEVLCGDNVQLACERAKRLKQASVKVPPSKLAQAKKCLTGSKVKLDCVIGGAGETTTGIKIYEIRYAKRRKASELTVPITPSLLANCRYAEIRKELRRLKKAAGKAALKVWVDKDLPFNVISRIARMSSEIGANYFCVDYFNGCEKLRFDLTSGCLLEIDGVNEFKDFRKMTEAGMRRIVTQNIWEFYSEWMKEVEKIEIASPASAPTIEPVKKAAEPVSERALEKTPMLPIPPSEPQAPPTPVDEPILPTPPIQTPDTIRPPQTLAMESEAQRVLKEALSGGEKMENAPTKRAETEEERNVSECVGHSRLEGSDLKFI